jgi:hypothetical protein
MCYNPHMPKRSPFPGMDPYLERHGGDIHHRLVQYACDYVQDQLPGRLRARVEERVYVESDEVWTRNIFPDVRIVEHRGRPPRHGVPALQVMVPDDDGGVAVAEPLVVQMPSESLTEGFIEILDGADGSRVVTVIEVLSLANKAGARGTSEYRRKQGEVLSGNSTSLVEIDLLRRGKWITAVPRANLPPSHRTPYHVCIHRAWRGDDYEAYPIALRGRLPIIPIPLRRTDRDARLDLQALIDQAYRLGRYNDLDYSQKPDPPLEDDDAKWAEQLIEQAS